jgi:NNP family nitrate/nitrite transporter-like MFS transporter
VPTDQRKYRIAGSMNQALWIATLGFFGGFAGVAIFGPLVPKFTLLLGLTPAAAGLLSGIPNFTGSLLRIPFGAWVDSRGGKRPFLILLGITLLGIALLLLLLRADYPNHMAGLYPILLILGMLIGSGIATFSVGIAQVSYWFPKSRQGGPLGVYAGLGNAAPGLSSWLLPVAVGGLGLLSAYSIWFGLLLVIAILYAVFIKDAPWFQLRRQGAGDKEIAATMRSLRQDMMPAGSTWQGLREAARVPETWALVLLYFLSFGGFLALTTWLPSLWHVAYKESLTTGGVLTLTFSLLASLVRVPGGLLADRVTVRFALMGNLAIMLVGALVMAFAPSVAVAVGGEVVLAVGIGLQNAVVFKLVPRYVPQAVGGASGWVGGLGAFGGFVLPPLMGYIAGQTGTYPLGLLAVVAVILVDMLVVGWLGNLARRHGTPADLTAVS